MAERPILFSAPMVRAILDGSKTLTRRVSRVMWPCPYGEPGDTLWVREALRPRIATAREVTTYDADGATAPYRSLPCDWPWKTRYLAARYCPRWASRITLEVTSVRVERLRSIPCHDIRAEGVDCPEHDAEGCFCCSECRHLRGAFEALWDSINAARGYSWASNPSVWVVEFRRVTP